MLVLLTSRWYVFAVRGVAAILFGLLTLVWPGVTVAVLVALFGAYALVDGVLTLLAVARGRVRAHRALVGVEGAAGVVAGAITFVWPGITALALLYVVAAWAFVTGVIEVSAAVRLRRELTGEWLLALGGVASLVAGLALAVLPGVGIVALAWLVGVYAIAFGVLLAALAFRLHAAAVDLAIDLRVPAPARSRTRARSS